MRILIANEDKSLDEALQILRHGGIVAHATETCYGFACDLTNDDAVRKLFVLKMRPEDQPVSALFLSIEEAKKWVEWNDLAEQLARKHLPGPLTIVLRYQVFPLRQGYGGQAGVRCQEIFSKPKTNNQKPATLGFRVSSHPIAQELAELTGVPLSTTSANLHGKPETYSVAEILDQFSDEVLQPDLILDSGFLPPMSPSTIVDLTENTAKILRQGGTVI